ncbi:ATP-dependent DNA helicase [Virgibacillus sp. MG-45]|uniref:ATP-dependent DNA helicase n=1 Tax=Virgibacillus sp. MG-45 TaxID=3102791 RepID=UPI002ED77C06
MTYINRISVRALVEHVFRSGSIESGFRTTASLTEGTRIHQTIQKTYRDQDQKEVYLKTEISVGDITLLVDGRCDGLLVEEDGSIIIDEIKSTKHALAQVTADSYPVHWAQANFYGYMYAKDHALEQVTIQLTYVQTQTGKQKQLQNEMSFKELEDFVHQVVNQYASFANRKQSHAEKRTESSKALAFPFASYRDGQRKLAGTVYKTIESNKNLFARAATGIGKTMSTIFPAIKAIGEGHIERIFYLTAKTITRTAAEEALKQLIANGVQLKVVTITAKDKICFQEEIVCDKANCIFADGYYDRINGAMLDILEQECLMTRNVIESYARKHQVCPFEFSLDLAYEADVVICDYNYIFDPRVSLKRLIEEHKKQTALLIDEAHNLVDRAREMYSATLVKSHYYDVERTYEEINPAIAKSAKAVSEHLFVKKQEGFVVGEELDIDLVDKVEIFSMHAEDVLLEDDGKNERLLEAYFSAQAFVKIARLYDHRYTTYCMVDQSEVSLKLFCMDPSHLIKQMSKGFRSKVFFSATLIPGEYYKKLLGGTAEDYTVSIPSPFEREKVKVMIKPLSTRYRDRNHTINPMVEFFVDLMKKQSGNFLVFFPSYHYMQLAYAKFIELAPELETIVQSAGMSEQQREDFLAAFDAERKERLIGFAVLGGIFSEGVDLRGNRLQGVIIIGVGYPQIGLERDIIKDYFMKLNQNGHDYAYVYPGMNKVLQAGGRLIRTEADTGVIALVDDRFLQPKYQALLPQEWRHLTVERN